MEYFDLCPRLRLLHEFFGRTSASILAHRYCDLRFLEYMTTYPRRGNEMGLEVSFFDPDCWMYFYACAPIDEKAWERSIERPDDYTGAIGLKGHMATEVKLEPDDMNVAEKVCSDFQVFDATLTRARLSRYWAAFRNTMELAIVRMHTRKMDQRTFDGYVFMAVHCSFFKFAEKVNSLPQPTAERAVKLMLRSGQDFAKSMAEKFAVGVLWHKPNSFIEPPMPPEWQQQQQFQYAPQQPTQWFAQHQHHLPYSAYSQPTYSAFAQSQSKAPSGYGQRPQTYTPYSPFAPAPKGHSPFAHPGMYY